jgi:hypothetical protein
MGNHRIHWLDSDQICGVNCSIKIEITDKKIMLTDMQDCYTEITIAEWIQLKKDIKETNAIPKDFDESVCFTDYERAGFIQAIKNAEFE